MTVLECEQGGAEWQAARLGIPTASCFGRILTPGGALSKSRDRYLAELLAEWALGEPIEDWDSEWVARGRILEPQARDYYAFQSDVEPRTVGFCYLPLRELHGPLPRFDHIPPAGASIGDEAAVGASPDGLVGDDGGLELKVPSAPNHLLYLAGGVVPSKYAPQVQGCLWVTGRKWWDWMSYHPDLPALIVRVAPDPKYQDALTDLLPAFHAELMAGRQSLIEKGVEPADPRPMVPDMRKHGQTISEVSI